MIFLSIVFFKFSLGLFYYFYLIFYKFTSLQETFYLMYLAFIIRKFYKKIVKYIISLEVFNEIEQDNDRTFYERISIWYPEFWTHYI